MKAFFISIPHSGEHIPAEAHWLKGLPETVLMCDVDRYVDQLYGPALKFIGVPAIVADIHRYVIDLNRVPEDIDQDSVEDSTNPPGSFTTGLHWSQTTTEAPLMREPITQSLHQSLVQKHFYPFHSKIQDLIKEFKVAGHKEVFHLDAHSMPSVGTAAHRDPGQKRAEIVVSDQEGTSCKEEYKDLVIRAYTQAGFQVAYNWPYKGGRITQVYGKPELGQHTLQVEMNRALYMDEATKKKRPEQFQDVQRQLTRVLASILDGLNKL